jgi:hemerythrin-like domain-containing protein
VSGTGLLPVLLERLSRDHARIAGVVQQLSGLADSATEVPDWEGLDELVGFLDYYADRVHHPLEDRLFDHLVNKGLTPTERQLVFRNLRQHEEIKSMTEHLSALVAEGRKGRVVDVPTFLEDVSAYVALQRRHMQFEENQLFPLLDQAFDNSDWNALMGILDTPEQERLSQQSAQH